MEPRLQPVIRLFVSSTFSDLKEERNRLQQEVFPELERFCLDRQFQFQAIDLRWGVPGEAGLDHRTMRICFDELRRAQEVSPRPNFLVLLGNRYGWRPLPEEITEAEFQSLAEKAAAQAELAILRTWYRRDENAVPAVYALRSRRDTPEGDEHDYTLDTSWNEVQGILWAVINRAFPPTDLAGRFQHIPARDEPLPSLVKFQTSATEQEIWRGALAVADASEHVVAWFREIQNRDEFQGDARAKDFFDADAQGCFDSTQQDVLEQLKAALTNKLQHGVAVPKRVEVTLQPTANASHFEVTRDHLKPMCEEILQRLKEIIEKQIDEYWRTTATSTAADMPQQKAGPSKGRRLELELLAHERFGAERAPADQFVGREDELGQIGVYLADEAERGPLVVHGTSGVGKTAILARAAKLASAAGLAPIVRFLGTTPQSSDVRGLLTNLCRELRQRRPVEKELPTDLHELQDELYSHLASATADKPIVLFLDALDQLDEADGGRQLIWLRTPLPPHVNLVVSCISGVEAHDLMGEPYRALQRRQLLNRVVEIESLRPDEAMKLLNQWLEHSMPRRTITKQQREEIEKRVQPPEAVECRRPLCLRILFEECRLWRSYRVVSAAEIGRNTDELLRNLLNRLSSPAAHGQTVKHALSYLAAARRGMTENEILEILWEDPDYKDHLDRQNQATHHKFPPDAQRIPIAFWARLRHDLAPYLSEHSAPGGIVLNFYHRQVASAVGEVFWRQADHRLLYHRRLAEYFDCQLNRFAGGTINLRKLSELPFQQAQADSWSAAQRTLEDLSFLETKVAADQLFDLANDFRRVIPYLPWERATPLRELEAALMADASWLSGRPERVFQQLFNHLWHRESDEGPARRLATRLWTQHAITQRPWLRVTMGPPKAYIRTMSDRPRRAYFLAVLPDGRVASSSLEEDTVKVWDPVTGKVWTTEPYVQPCSPVAALPDGRVALIGKERTVKVWDPDSGRLLSTEKQTTGMGWLEALADGRVALGLSDGTVRVWDPDRNLEWTTKVHDGWVECLATFPDGRIVSRSGDRTVVVWRPETGQLWTTGERVKAVAGPLGLTDWWCKLVATLPNGRVAFFSHDKIVKVWDPESGKTWSREGVELVRGVAALPDGRVAIAARNALEVWEPDSGQVWNMQEGVGVNAVASLPDGRVASGMEEGKVAIWDPDSGAVWTTREGLGVITLAPLPYGRVAFADCKNIKVWDPSSAPDRRGRGHRWFVMAVAVLPDGRVVSGGQDHSVCLWDPPHERLTVMRHHMDSVNSVAALPDGRIVSLDATGTMMIWDAEKDRVLTMPPWPVRNPPRGNPGRMWISRLLHGRLLMQTGTVARVLDMEAAQTRTLDEEAIWVAAAPDGHVALASETGTLMVWPPSFGKPWMIEKRVPSGSAVATLSGGLTVFPCGQKALEAWDPVVGKVWTTGELSGWVRLLGALTDGQVAFTCGNQLLLWHPRSGQLCTLDDAVPWGVTGLHSLVTSLADGRIVYGNLQGKVKVVDQRGGTALELQCNDSLSCVTAHPWLPRFAIGVINGDVLVIDVEPEPPAAVWPMHTTCLSGAAPEIPVKLLETAVAEGPEEPHQKPATSIAVLAAQAPQLPPTPQPTKEVPGSTTQDAKKAPEQSFNDVDLGGLRAGVLRETNLDPQRLVLWVKAWNQRGRVIWLRVCARGPLQADQSGELLFAPATTSTFHQRFPAWVRRVLAWCRLVPDDAYVLPTGHPVERLEGKPQDAVVFLSRQSSIEQASIARLWAYNRRFQQLSEKMMLVEGSFEPS